MTRTIENKYREKNKPQNLHFIKFLDFDVATHLYLEALKRGNPKLSLILFILKDHVA